MTVQSNNSSFYYGVLADQGNTVSQNTGSDAQVSVSPIAGNTVTGNKFFDVLTPLM